LKNLLIKNVRIINPFESPELIEKGWITIVDDKIDKVGSGTIETSSFDEVLDMTGKTVLPGMINLHHHLYSSLALGMPAPKKVPGNFTEILEEVWWKLDLALDEESTRASFESGLLECLRNGVTTIFDHHSSPNYTNGSLEMLVEISDKYGINISPSFEITDRNGHEYFESGLKENINTINKYVNHPYVSPLIGLHASFTISDKSLREISNAKGKHGVHIHVSEDLADETDAKNRGYDSVINRLDEFGLLDENSLIAHGIHISEKDVETIVKNGSSMMHNPTSNANNQVGILSSNYIERLDVGLGTDGMQANLISEAKEGLLIRSSHKIDNIDYLKLLFVNNADISSKLFGLKLGKIQPGYQADLAFYNYFPRTRLDKGNILGHILFALGKPTDVISRGKLRISDGNIVNQDSETILYNSNKQSKILWKKMTE
jgi:putative selenium metabolism protein SsnA